MVNVGAVTAEMFTLAAMPCCSMTKAAVPPVAPPLKIVLPPPLVVIVAFAAVLVLEKTRTAELSMVALAALAEPPA